MQTHPHATANRIVERLRSETMPAHEQLDARIMSHDPFGSLKNYIPFLKMQYLFHSDLEKIYRDNRLAKFFPDLEQYSRLALLQQDLADLNVAAQLQQTGSTIGDLSVAESLGWLFVSEGSRLGAASLSRRAAEMGLSATFGARHLAVPVDGPAKGWREFVAILSSIVLSQEEQDLAIAGGIAAFEHILGIAKAQRWAQVEIPMHG